MWFTPVQLTIITFFLYQELGPTSLIAIAVVATQVPLQIGLAKLFSALRYVKMLKSNFDSTVRIGYSVTASDDLSVIAMKSRIIKSKTLPHHANCIGYSDLGYSDKPVITIGRREAKRTKLYKR